MGFVEALASLLTSLSTKREEERRFREEDPEGFRSLFLASWPLKTLEMSNREVLEEAVRFKPALAVLCVEEHLRLMTNEEDVVRDMIKDALLSVKEADGWKMIDRLANELDPAVEVSTATRVWARRCLSGAFPGNDHVKETDFLGQHQGDHRVISKDGDGLPFVLQGIWSDDSVLQGARQLAQLLDSTELSEIERMDRKDLYERCQERVTEKWKQAELTLNERNFLACDLADIFQRGHDVLTRAKAYACLDGLSRAGSGKYVQHEKQACERMVSHVLR